MVRYFQGWDSWTDVTSLRDYLQTFSELSPSLLFVTRPFLAAAMIVSGWFAVGGFMKKGSLNSTTAEGLLLGNFPIWTFGFWSIQLIQLSLYDYYRNLSICQDQLGQSLVSLIVCAGTQEALGLILLFGASLAFASAVTLACLLTLRRQSTRN